jgi:hypothetical protein
MRFLDRTRHTTLDRTPLDEWSARLRDLYLTTHNNQKRQTSMPPAGFEPQIPTRKRPLTHALDCAATGIGILPVMLLYFYWFAYPLLITACRPRHNTAAETQEHRTSWWTICQRHWLPSASIIPSTFNTGQSSLSRCATEFTNRHDYRISPETLSVLLEIVWTRSSC